jgi:hypothetical protein
VYTIARLKRIGENYLWLRGIVESGGLSFWDKVTGVETFFARNWTYIVEELADFDNAVKALRFTKKFEDSLQIESGEDETKRGLSRRDYREMVKYLNGRRDGNSVR